MSYPPSLHESRDDEHPARTPVPPRPVSTYSSSSRSSSKSLVNIVPTTATRGRRASASSHNLLMRPATSLSLRSVPPGDDHSTAPSPSHTPLPPSHLISGFEPLSKGIDDHTPERLSTISATSSRSHLAAALANLPWAEPPPRSTPSAIHSKLPSAQLPSSATTTEFPHQGYPFLENDPSATQPMHSRSPSRASVVSFITSRRDPPGMACRAQQTSPPEADWVRDRLTSGYSGMADVPSDQSEESLARSLSAVLKRLSRLSRSSRSMRSSRSDKITNSQRSMRSKRASGSTTHRWGGKQWEVDREPLVPVVKDEELDLSTLAGRAAVLERMLRAGRRVSNASIRSRRQSASSSHHRFAPRSPHPWRPSASSRLSASSARTPKSTTPRTSRSIRNRLSKRVERTDSRADTFTELTNHSQEEIDHMQTGGITVFPERISLPPILPEKPKQGIRCKSIVYIDPIPPTPPFDHTLNEKRAVDAEEGVILQSPHLGHRSPGWRNRQSVMSRLFTGDWDRWARRRWMWAVGVGAGLVVIIIAGLLAGLLVRRAR